jgi:hypothetical protein
MWQYDGDTALRWLYNLPECKDKEELRQYWVNEYGFDFVQLLEQGATLVLTDGG